jgi:hypothetical protein
MELNQDFLPGYDGLNYILIRRAYTDYLKHLLENEQMVVDMRTGNRHMLIGQPGIGKWNVS